jgi:histidinol-phosphate phosphatase family protein
MNGVDVVIPTVGRPSLARLLEALAHGTGGPGGAIVLVEDRPGSGVEAMVPPGLRSRVRVLRGQGRGPAAARNLGWRASDADWIAFLDDDVLPDPDWASSLLDDIAGAADDVGGIQGRLRVPLPSHQRPTDWERNVRGLERARWATADMAYRRAALERVGGFDERFPRAYREDADLGLRVTQAGYRIVTGRRTVAHPVRPADRWVSVRLQAGNADDVLIAALHGRDWRRRAGAPAGRFRWHAVTLAAAAAGLAGLLTGHRRLAVLGLPGWAAGTTDLALRRILPGPRTRQELTTMLLTTPALPFAAVWHRVLGWLRLPATLRRSGPRAPEAPPAGRSDDRPARPAAVLLDRDGTLVVNIPYNGDPSKVRPVPGARQAVQRLRSAGVPVAVVSNQSAVGRGLITEDQLQAVNRRVEELLGPLGPWLVCPHAPEAGCDCRKPSPGLVVAAAHRLGVDPGRCVMIGDTGADVDAAVAAGARAILVPNDATRREEVVAAPEVAADLVEAVDRILGGAR